MWSDDSPNFNEVGKYEIRSIPIPSDSKPYKFAAMWCNPTDCSNNCTAINKLHNKALME